LLFADGQSGGTNKHVTIKSRALKIVNNYLGRDTSDMQRDACDVVTRGRRFQQCAG